VRNAGIEVLHILTWNQAGAYPVRAKTLKKQFLIRGQEILLKCRFQWPNLGAGDSAFLTSSQVISILLIPETL